MATNQVPAFSFGGMFALLISGKSWEMRRVCMELKFTLAVVNKISSL